MGFLKKTFIISLAILSVFVPSNSVFALSSSRYNLYSQNSIFFYDPDAKNPCVSGADGELMVPVEPGEAFVVAGDNASTVMANLLQYGYTQNAAAGIMGNLMVESAGTMSPKIVQGGSYVDDTFRPWTGSGKASELYNKGFGIAQWTSEGRVRALQEYADSHSLPVTSIEAQVGYLLVELQNPGYKSSPSALNGMSVEEATFMVARWFESPGDFIWYAPKNNNKYSPETYDQMNPTDTPNAYRNFSARLRYAQQFAGVTPTGIPSETVVNEDGIEVNCLPEGSAPTGTSINNSSEVKSFLQCDSRWGDLKFGSGGINGNAGSSICSSGCGPTSFASIMANFGMNITPADTTDVAGKAGMYISGSGSSHSITQVLASHYGMGYSSVNVKSVDEINGLLKSGYMIHIVGKGSMPFTSGGHYVAIVGIADDGNWIIADPGHSSAAVATYSPSSIVDGAHAGGAVRR